MSSWKNNYIPPTGGGGVQGDTMMTSGGGGGGLHHHQQQHPHYSSSSMPTQQQQPPLPPSPSQPPQQHYHHQQQQQYPQQQQQQYYPPQPPVPSSSTVTNNPTTTVVSDGPRNKCDAIVFEAIAKAAEIVVGSRCYIDPTSSSSSSNHSSGGPFSSQQQQQQSPFSTSKSPSRGNGNGSSSSSRFNLLVPEVQGVRSILQRWKRALHVPLRLDVYYQHPDSQRELLERWCLEYAPNMGGNGSSGPGRNGVVDFISSDPIVQLRHVCKNIVIWLRALYCWTHILPAQALRKLTAVGGNNNNNGSQVIGFSIYVVSEGQDDVSGLVSSQGFHSQGQPQSVHTPYGELGWKVFYAPKPFVQKLLPEISPYHGTTTTTTYASLPHHHEQQQLQHVHNAAIYSSSRPIPMRQQQQQQDEYYDNAHQPRNGTEQGIVQSAPQHLGHNRLYQRSNSDVPYQSAAAAARAAAEAHQPMAAAVPRSYHHHRHDLLLAARKAKSGDIVYNHHAQGEAVPTSGGSNGRMVSVKTQQNQTKVNGGDSTEDDTNSDRPPTKNLSALSLALMMSDDQVKSLDGSSFNTNGTTSDEYQQAREHTTNGEPQNGSAAAAAENGVDHAVVEKRRAALHSAPPQFAAGVAATAGEYGYAYNSHIPQVHQTSSRGSDPTRAPSTPNASNTTFSQFQQGQPYGTSVSSSYSSNQNRHRLGSSPASMRPSTPLGATPPGYLLSGTPSTGGGIIGGMTPGGSAPNSLIPPRSAVTPPFVRPVGFMVDPPHQPLPPSATSQDTSTDPNASRSKIHPPQVDAALQQHQTSLDSLHSSPFQYPPGSYSFHNSSLQQQFASPAAGDGTVLAPAAFMNEFYHRGAVPPDEHAFTSGFPAAGGSFASGQDLAYDDTHDMPFAVDSGSMASHPAIAGSTSGTATTGLSTMMNEASLVASMCAAAPKRLALFDSKINAGGDKGETGGAGNGPTSSVNNIDSVIDSLANELADFHNFGASLTDSQSGALPPATASASS